jgi:hypothetical protein
VNCFDPEEQPHGSTKKSTPLVWSGSSSFDPMDRGLPRRPLGKKKKHVVYSARGPSRLNSNLHTWAWMFLSFKLAFGPGSWESSGPVCWVRFGPQTERASVGLLLAENQNQSIVSNF